MSRIFFVLLAVALLVGASPTARADDTQQWSELKLVTKCTEHVDLFAATTLRLADADPTLNRISGQLGFDLRPVTWLTFSPSYQYIVNEPADADKYEHRAALVAALGVPIGSAQATFSTGFEYRIRESREDSWRLRPKLKLKHALGPKDWKLDVYLADELFYDSTEEDFVRNRFFAGLEKKLGDDWSADVYYCRQHAIRSRDPDLNIFGISMKLRLDPRWFGRRL